MEFTRGQRAKLSDVVSDSTPFMAVIESTANDVAVDRACFGLNEAGKLVDDQYMIFFNQPVSPCGGIALTSDSNSATEFTLDLDKLPSTINRLVFTLSVDGVGTLAKLQPSEFSLHQNAIPCARFGFSGKDFREERAAMILDIYKKGDVWRINANAQGFDGGLEALVTHFGGEVAEAVQEPSSTVISLEKRVEKEAPQLLSLVKAASVSLVKAGLAEHRAKVCLCLDISGSMAKLYKQGLVQTFAERILALSCRLDDDGQVDVFLFGALVHQPEPMNLSNCRQYIERVIRQYPLEGDTRYGLAMHAVRSHYFPDVRGGERVAPFQAQMPVYVMFVTDGGTSDKSLTERQLRWSSSEPIFWQFMGIGKGRKSKAKGLSNFAESDFPFLEKLDQLSGRLLDNAGFFSVLTPDEHPDAELYQLMMTEYPDWLKAAKLAGLLSE